MMASTLTLPILLARVEAVREQHGVNDDSKTEAKISSSTSDVEAEGELLKRLLAAVRPHTMSSDLQVVATVRAVASPWLACLASSDALRPPPTPTSTRGPSRASTWAALQLLIYAATMAAKRVSFTATCSCIKVVAQLMEAGRQSQDVVHAHYELQPSSMCGV